MKMSKNDYKKEKFGYQPKREERGYQPKSDSKTSNKPPAPKGDSSGNKSQ